VRALRERFADHPNVHVEDRDLRTLELDARFDSALMVNVLEPIADDAGALRQLSRLLVPGGNVVVYVPGLNGLCGALDYKIEHHRRYSVWRLRELGLEPVGRLTEAHVRAPIGLNGLGVGRKLGGGVE
jgi:SAM-dependent methyltransferase